MKDVPMVSVVMITYNHEDYIKQAIEGVLMQQCSFNIELIISDDCSTDKTASIVVELKREHPNGKRINFTSHKLNKGAMSNFIWALMQANGKYTALCEGDDYWTDPHKLQKQVDFLNSNPEYIICSHCVKYFYEQNNSYSNDVHRSGDYTIEDLTMNVPFQLVSVIFRNDPNQSFPEWLTGIPTGDWGVYLYLMQYGKAKKLEEFMAVYRIHSNGVWSGQPNNKNNMMLKSLSILKDKFSDKINLLLTNNFIKYLILNYSDLIKSNQYIEASRLYENHKIDIPQEYQPLFEVIPSVLIAQQKQLTQKNELIEDLMKSKSYKLGRKIIKSIRFILPLKREANEE